MAGSKEHVLVLPKAVFALRIVQLVTAVAVMGLAAYGITFLSFDGINLTMFTAIATIVITVYIIVAETCAPIIYNYWAILGLDIFAIVFWLVSFAYLASEVAAYQIVTDTCSYTYYGYCLKKRDMDLTKRATTDVYTYRNSMAAASGLGGLEFLLFIATLAFTSVYLHRHRKAGGHCMPNSTSSPTPAAVESGYGAPSFATTALESQKPEMDTQAYTQPEHVPQVAQPMQAAGGQGQGYGGQPAYA
ncbi:uncharacterized protein PAC_08895 [Phialocephala subalpina]|uniref:MARVEL domain-containing protein n=1 Tax=Phialocephala subalpina TaxID=576137 RepID=A0A1L7X1V7_9HELO|nr:uncharacterized protein PAC_08895 [Phialocephala subalpina]